MPQIGMFSPDATISLRSVSLRSMIALHSRVGFFAWTLDRPLSHTPTVADSTLLSSGISAIRRLLCTRDLGIHSVEEPTISSFSCTVAVALPRRHCPGLLCKPHVYKRTSCKLALDVSIPVLRSDLTSKDSGQPSQQAFASYPTFPHRLYTLLGPSSE